MEQEIIDGIYHLFRSRMAITILILLEVIVLALVITGTVKWKLTKHPVLLVILVVICSIGLLTAQFTRIIPIHKDYVEQSYVVLYNVKLRLTTKPTDHFAYDPTVAVTDSSGTQYEFKIENDLFLELGVDYTGTIAYVPHSNYVVWYCFD